MKRRLFVATLAAFATLPARATTEGDLARCRAIDDGARRLACYDALAPAAPAPPAPVPAAALAPAPAPSAEAAFGLEHRQARQAPEAVESRIPGRFDGWGPNDRIRLANGQVWQIVDDSRGVMSAQDPKVRVTRAALGSFLMEIEGKRQAPRVRRVE